MKKHPQSGLQQKGTALNYVNGHLISYLIFT